MASSVSAWAKPGAWALDAEHEASMGKEDDGDASLAQQPQQEFPSLAAAASSKTSKKKKKAQPISFAEFTTGKPVAHGTGGRFASSSSSKGLTADELILLPTGPRERSAEELERSSSRGFGYTSYGAGGSRGRAASGEDSDPSRWGSSRGSDDARRGGFGGSGGGSERELGPSRADEIDDWGAAKKSLVPERRERGGTGGFFDSQSKADESDSWISSKSVAPPVDARRIGNSGFDAPRERRGGFDMFSKEGSFGAGADSETWGRKKDFVTDPDTERRETERNSGERRRLVLQPRSSPAPDGNSEQEIQGEQHKQLIEKRGKGSNPFGEARPREEVLAGKEQDSEQEIQGEQHKQPIEKRGKGSNPFGDARPREEVLARKGQDWKKIDEQLETIKIRDVLSESSSFGRKGLEATNETQRPPESRADNAWRKADATVSSPASKYSNSTTSVVDHGGFSWLRKQSG
ncbi:eukaryotic translation initiation factor 4B3-like isoform X2 [Zingiber officinale]|uniref:eukaryotic translation initiation factor 4B3-like isoform X2 n=1 Tax=Zingiber officinale TaxID=94328 RepID=UPI001C4C442A|nr:eukaryotic translation initiation factor 4B3-like isoform X2 [Zingiber officinale]